MEHNSISHEVQDVLMEVRKIEANGNNVRLLEKIAEMEENFAGQQMQINNLKLAVERAGSKHEAGGGTTYVRWGRKKCPGNGSETTYDGFAAGSYFNDYGGASSMLCLTPEPEFENYDDAKLNAGGRIYGTEYGNSKPNLFTKSKYQQDVPCAVCEVKRRSSTMMVPGRKTCYPGWTREYWGYLMTGSYTHKAGKDYYCVDGQPETLFAGATGVAGSYLFYVEGRCGSLYCPPYEDGRELTCVVCTK